MAEIVYTSARDSLFGCKAWRNSLVALPIGTVLRWETDYSGSTLADSIKAGQHTKVMFLRRSNGVSDMAVADQCYTLGLCDKNGKVFRRKFYWRVEGVARSIHNGNIAVTEPT